MDLAHAYTDKQIEKLQHEIEIVYKQAEIDIRHKMKDFEKRYRAKESIYKKEVKQGKMTQEQFDNWKKGQVFQREQWKAKRESVLHTMQSANQTAVKMINGQTTNVFAVNANYTSYNIEHGAGVNFGFGIYDSAAVVNLIKDNPQVLPKWKINESKDYTWSQKKVNRAITQGIIQGESLQQIADRLTNKLVSSNKDKMLTFARTAMTGAQNSGRLTSMEAAKNLGIDLEKEWMATLDSRTRDSHASIDGERVPINSKFSNGLEYPGDANGAPAEVYNCRCTMVSNVKKYPAEYERYDNIDGKPIKNITYKEWYEAKGLNKGKQVSEEKATKEAEKKYEKAKEELAKLEQKIKDVGADQTFEGIWYGKTVTYADYESVKDSIAAKEQYYLEQIAKTSDPMLIDGFQKKLDKLKEFEKHGEEYSKLYTERNALKAEVMALKPKPDSSKVFGIDAYSQKRKDEAIWAKSAKDADNAMRAGTGEVWRGATQAEKEAIYEYTRSYSKFNEPLRGWEYGQSNYSNGTGFKGVGNTDLNAGSARNGNALNAMTDIIEKSTYDHDMWLQRGCGYGGMDKFFDVDMDLLKHGTQQQLEDALLGTTPTEFGFMSCGTSKGKGFDGDILLNVYAPEGTKMMYVEPFSAFGHGDGKSWDGVSEQSSFGSELETILQQGTQFRVTKVERTADTIYIDMEVIDQSVQQRWIP